MAFYSLATDLPGCRAPDQTKTDQTVFLESLPAHLNVPHRIKRCFLGGKAKDVPKKLPGDGQFQAGDELD
jgi:hypothetical protein